MIRPTKSTSLPSASYVLSLVSYKDYFAASASSPSNTIYLLDKSDLQQIGTLQGHLGGITALRSVPTFAGTTGQTLVSCGNDGAVKIWDHRSSEIAIQMNSPSEAVLLSLDVSPDGRTLAAGTEFTGEDASILYWDARKPTAPIHSHSSTHSDDVTVIRYNQANSTLLSASSDGLLCISNPTETEEDDTVIHIGNWGTSIAQAGWFMNGVWAASDMETFSSWSPELDKRADVNIRELNQQLSPTQLPWNPDYLISCQSSDNNLALFVGSNSGAFSICSSTSTSNPNWIVSHSYPSYHEGIVRAVLYDEQISCLLTGGEDSKINLWDISASDPSPSSSVRKRERIRDDVEVDDHERNKRTRLD